MQFLSKNKLYKYETWHTSVQGNLLFISHTVIYFSTYFSSQQIIRNTLTTFLKMVIYGKKRI